MKRARQAFYKEHREFSLAGDSGFLPCSNDLTREAPLGPSPVPTIWVSQLRLSAYLGSELVSCLLEAFLPPPSVAQSIALLCIWRQKAVPSTGTF